MSRPLTRSSAPNATRTRAVVQSLLYSLFSKPVVSAVVVVTMLTSMTAGAQAAAFPGGGVLGILALIGGQGNQESNDSLTSTTEVDASVENESTNVVEVTQDADGSSPATHNQDAVTTPSALSALLAAVDATADNLAGVDQLASDDGQTNQASLLEGTADTGVAVDASGLAMNTTTVGQTADDQALTNQDVETASNANTNLFMDMLASALNAFGFNQETTGEGQHNQEADAVANSTTDAFQGIGAAAVNDTTATQDASGDPGALANQAIDNGSTNNAFTTVGALQGTSAFAGSIVDQLAGDGENNQVASLASDSDAAAAQDIDADALNTSLFDQLVDASSPLANQEIASTSNAGTTATVEQATLAASLSDVAQEAGEGLSNQATEIENGNEADSDQNVDADSENLTEIFQKVTGGGSPNMNQLATNTVTALTDIEAGQDNVAAGTATVSQESGTGPVNQENLIGLAGVAGAAQTVDGLSNNTTTIFQDPTGGNGNQSADNVAYAFAGVLGFQLNASTNLADITQLGGSGQGNQANDVGLDSTAAGEQAVTGIATNNTSIEQLFDGLGNTNQGAGDPSSTAIADVEALQDNASANVATIEQTGGDKQDNQENLLDLVAAAGAGQTSMSKADNTTNVDQESLGAGNHNQAADAISVADADLGALQENLGINGVAIAQTGDAGQNNQSNDIGAEVLAGADQDGVVWSSNLVNIDQLADKDGNVNQAAIANAVADTDGVLVQDNGAANLVEIEQLGGTDQDNMENVTDLSAGAGAGQSLIADALNNIGISQDPVNGNQSADATGVATTAATAAQSNGSTNAFIASQDGDDGQNNFVNDVTGAAGALGEQETEATSANLFEIVQDIDKDGNFNQDIVANGVADTDVGALQANAATNVAAVDQTGGDKQDNFDNLFDLEAESLAGQDTTGTSANQFALSQDPVNGQGNQAMDVVGVADTDILAGQSNTSLNEVLALQVGDDGQDNYANDVDTDAVAAAGQATLGSAANILVGTQDILTADNANQAITANLVGATDIEVGQANAGVNTIALGQFGGDGQDNFANDIDTDAVAVAGQETLGNATNVAVLSQDPTNGNQVMDAVLVADTDILGFQTNVGLNDIESMQVGDDKQNNAELLVEADATAGALQETLGASSNVFAGTQEITGDGNHNQALGDPSLTAGSSVAVGQSNAGINTLGNTQLGGVDADNQLLDATMVADAGAVQLAGSVATNVAGASQDASGTGNTNQAGEIVAGADADTVAVQENVAGNFVESTQEASDGQDNEEGILDLLADADAGQGIASIGSNLIGLSQIADKDGNVNQDALIEASVLSQAAGDQSNAGVNTVEAVQGGGSGQGNESFDLALDADADAEQGVLATGVNTIGVLQDPLNGNQNATIGALAGAQAVGLQENVAGNFVGITQEFNDSQANQAVEAEMTADAGAEQQVIGVGLNTIGLTQDITDDGNINQNADIAADAAGAAGASQTNAAANLLDVDQDPSGQANQDVVAEMVANANAGQVVGSAAGNLIGAVQLAGKPDSNVNQDLGVEAGAASQAQAAQLNESANDVEIDQDCDGPVCAQGAEVVTVSNALAGQSVGSEAGNEIAIFQDPSNANQNIDVGADADSDVGAAQSNGALNTAGITQVCTGDVCAQYQLFAPTATAVAGQEVSGSASNEVEAEQLANATDSNVNQDQTLDSGANSSVGAAQQNTAENIGSLKQTCTGKVCAQLTEVAPTATAVAAQGVENTASNDTTATQEAKGDDSNTNQAIANTADADADTLAGQVNTASNDVEIEQECTGIVCASSVTAAPIATAVAEQDVDTDASNTNTITQDPDGGAANQDVVNSTTANATTAAGQLNEALNKLKITQKCDSKTCAQGGDINPVATSVATQTVANDASNDTNIEQIASSDDIQANQNVEGESTATSDVAVDHTNTATNDVTLDQSQTDSNSGNQSATINPTATATSNVTISGGSSNNVTITQQQ